MSQDYRGDLKSHSGLNVKKTGPLVYEVQVAPGIVWRQQIDQLRPTAVEPTDVQGVAPDTVEASEAEVVSPPPVAIQQSAPPNSSRDTRGSSTGDGFRSSTCTCNY